jgi:hypothetical protein
MFVLSGLTSQKLGVNLQLRVRLIIADPVITVADREMFQFWRNNMFQIWLNKMFQF